ncbi:hypothetical protein AAC387_Pa01g2381 [Persea americana]
MKTSWVQLVVLVLVLGGANFYVAVSGSTDSHDVAVLRSLKGEWQHTPPSWDTSDDPCDSKWEGIICNDSRVTGLRLSSMGLQGKLGGDIGGLTKLISLDLSNNSFDESEAPIWFSTIQSLTTLVMECGALQGQVPQNLFSFPQLQEVRLKHNSFNSTLNMGDSISMQLQLVDLENNQITKLTLSSSYSNTLKLSGNPVCTSNVLVNANYCQNQHRSRTYSTSYAHCGANICPSGQMPSPQSCYCAYPYKGTLYFRAPYFRDLSNSSTFKTLEQKFWMTLSLNPGSVSLQNPFFNENEYLQVHLELFPSTGKYFSRLEIQRIGFDMTNQTFKPPHVFGPFYFIADPYPFPDGGGSSISTVVTIGITVGCVLLVLMVVAVGAYAFWQKKRAERAIKLNKPFASWGSSTKDSGGAPQLKGARCFSYDELKSSTNNFLESNEIGSGGYGKVYKGILPGQQIIAIKRAQQGSMQGGLEFKTEIELLSRVHHKNLVSLIGFCFEQEEQMLIYEYVPNGTLRDSLFGRSGVHLNWKRRLRVALSSARGLAYLHELADPPIIHRDVKSSNILLDENLSAKVADFGLSKLVADSSMGHVSTQVKGTLGYMDPEYYLTQQLTEKSDVYSFGVVMLELVTAKPPIEKGKYIVREVKMVMNPNEEHYGLSELMDPAIRYENDLIGFMRFVDLAMQCVQEQAADRPMMSDMVKEIETILQSEGVKTDPNSASSSATDYGSKKDAPRHPYIDTMPKKEEISDAFDYSGGYTLSTKVEPK